MEQKTLVEAIMEDLKKKRPLAEIRKEYLDQDYPRLVIETAIDEARQRLDKSKRRFDLSDLDDKEESQPEKSREEKEVSILPLFVIILIIWLGIMVSFYLASPFGQAVSKLQEKKDTSFIPFCTKDLEGQGTLSTEDILNYCAIGEDAINKAMEKDTVVRMGCNNLYYRKQEVNSCTATILSVLDRYSP